MKGPNTSAAEIDLAPRKLQEVKDNWELARERMPEHPQRTEPCKGNKSDLWNLRAGRTDLLLVDFQNITSFPLEKALRGQGDSRATYLGDRDAHVNLFVEHHLRGEADNSCRVHPQSLVPGSCRPRLEGAGSCHHGCTA